MEWTNKIGTAFLAETGDPLSTIANSPAGPWILWVCIVAMGYGLRLSPVEFIREILDYAST
jgi:hypothetical protein